MKNFIVLVLGGALNTSLAVDSLTNAEFVKGLNCRAYERKQHYKQVAAERRINYIKERSMFFDQEYLLPSIAEDKELFYRIFNNLVCFGPQYLNTATDHEKYINELFRRITDDSSVEKLVFHNRKHTKQLTHQVTGWDFIQTQMPWQWKQIVSSTKKNIKNFCNKFNPIIAAIEYDGKPAIQLSSTITRKDFINDIQGITNVSIKNEEQFINLVLSIRHDDEKNEIHISHFFPNESKRKAITVS